MVEILLSITFACGLVIAGAHVLNRRFVAPVYDVVANLLAFASAVLSSLLLHNLVAAGLSAAAVGCWVLLAVRTARAIRAGRPRDGQVRSA